MSRVIALKSVFLDQPDPHWHKPRSAIPGHILFLVTSGSFVYRISGIDYALGKGDVLYMPYGTIREGIQEPGEVHQKYTIVFDVPDPSALPMLERGEVVQVKVGNYEYVKTRFGLLYQHWLSQLPYSRLMCEVIAEELAIEANREIEAAKFASPKLAHVQAMQHYMLKHYREPIQIADLASQIDRTPNYAAAIFKGVMGVTPMVYLQQVRVAAAKDLLLHTQMSIGEIAEYLGFYDTSHFHRIYRRYTGHPPSSR